MQVNIPLPIHYLPNHPLKNFISPPLTFTGPSVSYPFVIPGAHSLKNVLDDALKIGERCTNAEDEEAIRKTVSNINSMVDALCELKQQGEVRIVHWCYVDKTRECFLCAILG